MVPEHASKVVPNEKFNIHVVTNNSYKYLLSNNWKCFAVVHKNQQ